MNTNEYEEKIIDGISFWRMTATSKWTMREKDLQRLIGNIFLSKTKSWSK